MISTLASNIQNPLILILIGISVSLIQFLGSAGLGRILLMGAIKNNGGLKKGFHIYFAIGVAVQSIVISIFSIFKALSPLIFCIIFIANVYFVVRLLRVCIYRGLVTNLIGYCKKRIVYLLLIVTLVLYISSYCFIPSYGADIGIYHLVAVRDLVWNEGYMYNPFFYGAGIYQGWHFYGAPSFYVGGESAFLGLSVWTFIALLILVAQIVWDAVNLGGRLPELSALAVGILVVNFLLDSAPNNDIPATYIELIMVYYFLINHYQKNEKIYLLLIGIIGGLLISIKLTNIVGVFLIYIIYLYQYKNLRLVDVLILVTATIPLGLYWPILDIINYGSPLPQILSSIKLYGEFMPQLISSNSIVEKYHGAWYAANFSRILSLRFLPIITMILGVLLLPIIIKRLNIGLRKLIIFLIFYGTLKVALFLLISPRLDVLFHDRYHLVTYLFFVLAGLFCIYQFLDFCIRGIRTRAVSFMALSAFMCITIFSSSIVKFPNGDLIDQPSLVAVPSIFDALLMRLKLASTPWLKNDSKIISYVNKNTPINSKIGTLIMAPYAYNRPFAQLLPLAQSEIDLMLPPKIILEKLSKYGVSYLHLTNSPGLVPGVAHAIEPWLANINLIPHLENVHLLERVEYGNGIQESLYSLN